MDSSSSLGNRTIAPGIHRIEFEMEWPPGFVSAFVLTGDEPTLVDAGMSYDGSEQIFRDGLAEIGLTPADIEHVLITHPHVDHIGMVEMVNAASNATIYAPKSWHDRPPDTWGETSAFVREAGVPETTVETITQEVRDEREQRRELLNPVWVDEWVADGQQVTVGTREFTARATPGHHRDHLCFRGEHETDTGSEKVCFSGDMGISTFRAPIVHAIFQPEQKAAIQAYREALDRLLSMNIDSVYPGHGPAHDDIESAVEQTQNALVRLCDRTEAALHPSGTHAVDVVIERDKDPTSGPWVPEAVAALAHLEREGRATSYVEDGVRLYVPSESEQSSSEPR